MLGVRFLDVDFMRINFACALKNCSAYMLFLHSQIETLRDQLARRGQLSLRGAAAMTAGRATTGSSIGPTPAFQRGQAHQ
jgi:hypothetical protein